MTKTKKEIKGFWSDCWKAIRAGWKEDWAACVPYLVGAVKGVGLFASAVVKTALAAIVAAVDLTIGACVRWVVEKIKRA